MNIVYIAADGGSPPEGGSPLRSILGSRWIRSGAASLVVLALPQALQLCVVYEHRCFESFARRRRTSTTATTPACVCSCRALRMSQLLLGNWCRRCPWAVSKSMSLTLLLFCGIFVVCLQITRRCFASATMASTRLQFGATTSYAETYYDLILAISTLLFSGLLYRGLLTSGRGLPLEPPRHHIL